MKVQGRSLVDYLLTSKPMLNLFNPCVYSDHCMLSLTLSLDFQRFTIESNEVTQFKFVRQSDKESEFVKTYTCDSNYPNISYSEFANYFKCVNNPTSPFLIPG